jgi:multiple sugar transport system permease protein
MAMNILSVEPDALAIQYRRSRIRRRSAQVLKVIFAVIVSVIALFPIWWMFNVVFTNPGEAASISPRLWPTSISGGIDNVRTILGDAVVVSSLGKSVVESPVQSLGTLFIASLAGFEFAHGRFAGQRALLAFGLIGLMVPFAVTVFPLQRMVASLSWLNKIQGLTIPMMASGFALFLLTEYMRSVPRELFEAARVDGLRRFSMYWRIALPLTQNGLVAVGILVFITSWGNYLWPLLVATKPEMYPVSVTAAAYFAPQTLFTTNTFLTVALLSSLPLMIVYVILQRWIVESVARVGVRG